MICEVIWDINPWLFEIGSYQLRYYSLFFALAFALSYIIMKKIYQNEQVALSELDSLTIYVIIGGLLGARIGNCLFYDWAYYSNHLIEIILPFRFYPELKFTGYQGLASHGGAIGVIIALIIFKNKSQKKSFFWLLDRVVVPTGFAGAFIRLGNLMNSEIYGHQTDLPWGFVFVRNGDTIASHPTQIYEALFYVITSIILIKLYQVKKYRDAKGFLTGAFFILVFGFRFFIEFIKNNQEDFEQYMTLNMGQVLSIPIVIAGVILVYFSLRNSKKDRSSL